MVAPQRRMAFGGRGGARIQAEFHRRGEMERCTRRSDDGASRASGCLPAAPLPPEGENRAEARAHFEAFLELLGVEKGWVENQAGERAGVMPPARGTMSGSARPCFEDISDDTPSNQNISRKFG